MNYPGFNEALNRYHTLRSMHSDARTYSGNRGNLSLTEATTQ